MFINRFQVDLSYYLGIYRRGYLVIEKLFLHNWEYRIVGQIELP